MPLTLSGNRTISDLASAPTVGGTALPTNSDLPTLSTLGIPNHDDITVDSSGRMVATSQPHIFGTPHIGTEAASGIATIFRTYVSRGGLSFANNRITVPVSGVYFITYQTICQTDTGRHDTNILLNGANLTNGLNEANGDGYHQRTHSCAVALNANDYIQFYNERYYSDGSNFDAWTTASVTLIS